MNLIESLGRGLAGAGIPCVFSTAPYLGSAKNVRRVSLYRQPYQTAHACQMMFRWVSVYLLLFPCLFGRVDGAHAEPLPTALTQALEHAGIDADSFGLVVQALDAPTPALSHGAERPFNPASTLKLLTTLAALDTWGPAHTFKTEVWLRGELSEGVLYGDLILRGGGDPGLDAERFRGLLRELQARGLRSIRGDVRLDTRLYELAGHGSPGFEHEPLKPYNAAPSALLVQRGTTALRLTPEADRVTARLDPASLPVDNRLELAPELDCDMASADLDLRRADDTLVVAGRLPGHCGPRTVGLTLLSPEATTAHYFRARWAEMGGELTGEIRLAPVPDEAVPWFSVESQPLATLVRDINKHSHNVMAKMLYLNLGAHQFGVPATWDKGERAVRAWLAEKGLALPGLVLENGSGLSRVERITPAGLAALLHWAADQPLYYEFAASLPALGKEGTLRRRLKDAPQAGRAWLKTGSLDGVRALAGYLLDGQGRRWLLVSFINHPGAARAGPVLDALLRALPIADTAPVDTASSPP